MKPTGIPFLSAAPRFVIVGLLTLVLAPIAMAQTTPLNPSAITGNTNNVPTTEVTTANPTSTDPIADLNAQIEANKKKVQDLQTQADNYQKSVDQASSQANNIQGQISLIDTELQQTQVQIEAKQGQIDGLQLEMTAIQREIDIKTNDIAAQKGSLIQSLKELDASSRTSTLTMILSRSSLSDFYSQSQAMASITNSLRESVQALKGLRDDLQSKQDQLTQSRDDQKQAKLQLEIQQQGVNDQKDLKTKLLGDVQQTASQYGDLLQQANQEEQQANANISALEKKVRDSLANNTDTQPQFSSKGFMWPVKGDISALFHDPTYPFRCAVWHNPYCMEHSGLDIRTPQGTPVHAAADGIVSVVADQGFYYDGQGNKTRSALNYVGLVHQDGLSSRYLHLTAIYVKPDQFVKQGDIIGLSGGLPGTAGSGGMTTGAHLHFEIREDGIPTDPLKYLP